MYLKTICSILCENIFLKCLIIWTKYEHWMRWVAYKNLACQLLLFFFLQYCCTCFIKSLLIVMYDMYDNNYGRCNKIKSVDLSLVAPLPNGVGRVMLRAAPPVYSRTRRCQIMRVTGGVYVNRSERLATPHVKFILRVWSRNERGAGFCCFCSRNETF